MKQDKSWLYINRLTPAFDNGLREFIRYARQFLNNEGKIRCPCKKCCNTRSHTLEDVYAHCFDWGWAIGYTTWFYHGETCESRKCSRTTQVVFEAGDEMAPVINDFLGRAPEEKVLHTKEDDNIDELLSKLHEHVYPGCKNSSALKFLADLMHIKVLYKWPNESFDVLLTKLKEVLPEGSNLPDSFYKAKTLLGKLDLGYEKIEVWANKHRNPDGSFVNDEAEAAYKRLLEWKERLHR